MTASVASDAVQADTTKLPIAAIVNAAKSSLFSGGGVEGTKHRAAGTALLHECRLPGNFKTTDAKLTNAYRPPLWLIIHKI